MNLIRHLQDWQKYQDAQENRAIAFEPIHYPDVPKRFPVLVVTNMSVCDKAKFVHFLVYESDAKKLLNYAKTQSNRQKTSRRRLS